MALIVCPECQKEVSNQAASCPACGYPIAAPKETRTPEPAATNVVTIRKSRGLYIVLGLFFGLLGVHNFYAGYYGLGAVQLILGVSLFFTVVVPIFLGLIVIWELFTTTVDGNGVAFD